MENNLQMKLAVNGFLIIDLLGADEVNGLNELCIRFLRNGQADFVSSSHILSKEDSAFINDKLHSIIDARFDAMFPEFQLLGGTLATKIKGTSNLEAHQDWSIVDESKYNSYNLWIPLVDTDTENGTLGLIPGSHLWKQQLRGLNIPNVYGPYTERFLKIGYEPALKAGQAILYNHKLIHYSRPNKINQTRNVAIVGVKDKEASLCVSFCPDGRQVETYQAREEDFYGFDALRIRRDNKLLHTEKLLTEKETWEEIGTMFNRHLPEDFSDLLKQRESLFSKLLDKLKFSN